MPYPHKLADLALRVDELLLRPGHLGAARKLAGATLDDPMEGHVDSLQLTHDPDNPYDWTPMSLDRERGLEETPILTPGQMALSLAALHEVYCPGFEKVVVIPTDVPQFGNDGKVTRDYRRAVRWAAILVQVRKLGDHAARWFTLLLRHFEPVLSSAAAQDATHRLSKEERERVVREYLKAHKARAAKGEVSIREIHQETRVPTTSIHQTAAWKALQDKLEKGGLARRPRKRRAQAFTSTMDAASEDPALHELIREQAADDEGSPLVRGRRGPVRVRKKF